MRHRNFLALAMSLVCFALPAAVSAQWVTTEIDTLAGTAASERSTRFSVAVDATDSPHALWSRGSQVFYSRKVGNAWITPIELSQADASYTAHAVAVVPGTSTSAVLLSRTPFGAPAGELRLLEWNGTGFDTRDLTMDGASKFGPVLAMDGGGAYHVVFVVQASGQWRLRYLTNVTGVPTDMLLPVGPLGDFGSGAAPAIAVEPDGTAHVVYRGVSSTYRIHHAENSTPGGTSWSWQALISPNAADTGSDVTIDPFGTVYVAASGDDCETCTRRTHIFQRPSGGAWSAPSPIIHTSGLSGPSLKADSGGQAHIALSEISGSLFTGRIFYASSSTGWVPSLVIGNDHGTPSLAVDSVGRDHLVCTTGPNTGVRNVLYLGSSSKTVGVSEGRSPGPITWRASPNPFHGETVLRSAGRSAETTGDAPVFVYDVAGRIVRRLEPVVAIGAGAEYRWDGQNEAGQIVPAGIYWLLAGPGPGGAPVGGRATRVVKLP